MCFPLEYFVKGNVIYQVDIPSLGRTSGLLAANGFGLGEGGDFHHKC